MWQSSTRSASVSTFKYGLCEKSGVLPAVQDGNLRPPGCALVAEGADAGGRGDRDATLRTRDVEPEQA